MYEDNLARIDMSINPVCRNIRKHYLRELSLSGIVKLIPSRTHHMVADAQTKSLPAPGLARHRSVMMGHSMRAYPRVLSAG